MPRRRMIDPEIWRNEKFGSLSDAARLLFIGIFSQADDDGRLKASPAFLMATIFPYDKDKTIADIKQMRDQCAALGLIRVYTYGDQEYLDIPGWYEHQQIRKDRYQPSKLPPFNSHKSLTTTGIPDDTQMTTTGIPDDTQMTTTGCPSIVKYSLVKSSLGECNNPPPGRRGIVKGGEAQKFEIFWQAYPKKRNKGQAERAFKKVAPDEQLMAAILTAIERAKKSAQWLKDNGRYIPYPATWLNARGWEDEFTNGGVSGVDKEYPITSDSETKRKPHGSLHNDLDRKWDPGQPLR